MVDLSVKIGNVSLKNPIMPASGCFSTDLAQVMDVNRLGALVAKTVSREYRIGNPTPRVAELGGATIRWRRRTSPCRAMRARTRATPSCPRS